MLIVDPRSAVPPYEQIRVQILEQVRDGELVPETRLPTVRKLADDLGVAPNTVARTYRELEHAGIIETRGRHGTFVSTHGDPAQRQAQRAAAAFADQMRELGIGAAEAIALVTAALPTDDTAARKLRRKAADALPNAQKRPFEAKSP